MSVESLLQSKYGARTSAQVDDLLEVARSDHVDPEMRLKIVKILKKTIKDDVLLHFIDRQGGLSLIHGWLKEWTEVGPRNVAGKSLDAEANGGNAADHCVETLKLLRQLPVSNEQLKQNAELGRFLRRLSKSNGESRLVVDLAKEVVDLWKAEVKGGAEVFLQRDDRPRDVAKKNPSSGMVSPSTRSRPSSSKSDSALTPLKKIEETPASKAIEEGTVFAEALEVSGLDKNPIRVKRCREADVTKEKRVKRFKSVESVNEPASIGVASRDVSQDARDLPATSHPTPDSSRKRVHWDPGLFKIVYFDPLPPLSDDDDDCEESLVEKMLRKKEERKRKWKRFWHCPAKLDDDVFPMPFVQPGSASVEKRNRESRGGHPWRKKLFDATPRHAVTEAVDEGFEGPGPLSEPKEIPLEPVEDFVDSAQEQDFAREQDLSPAENGAFTPQITATYSLFPSPPYSL